MALLWMVASQWWLREAAAEFLGTFVLIVFGTGVVAQVAVAGDGGTKGDYLSINIGWALGVMFGAQLAYGVSGAHLNPAVTLAMTVFRGAPVKKLPLYVAAQVLGAFCAAGVVHGLYKSSFDRFHDMHDADAEGRVYGANATAGVFSTYPLPWVGTWQAFLNELVATAMLIVGIMALTDGDNNRVPDAAVPGCVALLVLAIGCALGANTGYAINPARDFGPRLWTGTAGGWGADVFTVRHHYMWIPIVGPLVGGLVGGAVYTTAITLPSLAASRAAAGLHTDDEASSLLAAPQLLRQSSSSWRRKPSVDGDH
eukprot:TRINITY_DN44917_c0_g1_i1.p1 TRINITY_DN44917_c0_g1~~TRINITY_DN44917_c0_g1_i1.p1  ORF type:complete len:330 (+),score=83.70 TRINITY_DN44917_c0_g1_i1:56-991(+)